MKKIKTVTLIISGQTFVAAGGSSEFPGLTLKGSFSYEYNGTDIDEDNTGYYPKVDKQILFVKNLLNKVKKGRNSVWGKTIVPKMFKDVTHIFNFRCRTEKDMSCHACYSRNGERQLFEGDLYG